jgi:TPP-dependent pyruvate/acetoin dehydrogenase alpha subunit
MHLVAWTSLSRSVRRSRNAHSACQRLRSCTATRTSRPRRSGFFDDGATRKGAFYGSLNFAARHRLPRVFICDNNFFAIHTPLAKRLATERPAERVTTFGISSNTVVDGNIFQIRNSARAAVEWARAVSGPSFIECHTYRWREYVDPNPPRSIGGDVKRGRLVLQRCYLPP